MSAPGIPAPTPARIEGAPYSMFSVVLNGGDPITHANARSGGSWFDAALETIATDYNLLTAVSFQGTGFVDDLVVTRTDPFYVPSAFFAVYTVVGAGGSSDAPAVTNIAPGGNLTIVYTADQWYRISALEKDGVPVEAAAGLATYPQELTNIQADISNNVTFAQATAGQTGLPGGSWASRWYSTEAAAAADPNLADDYLLGLDPTGTYAIGFEISALDVDGNVTVTCKLTDGAAPLDTTINGSLKVYGKVALTDATWTEIGAATALGIEDFVNGEAVLGPFDAGTYNFFRAVIE